jgi:hypothetical protein
MFLHGYVCRDSGHWRKYIKQEQILVAAGIQIPGSNHAERTAIRLSDPDYLIGYAVQDRLKERSYY